MKLQHKNIFVVHKNFNVFTKVVIWMSQVTLTDADQRFSSWQALSSRRQNALIDVRVERTQPWVKFWKFKWIIFFV